MATLADKLRQARERWVEAGPHEFLVRRPLLVDILGGTASQILRRAIVDWRKVTEADVVPGGGGRPVSFDAELCEQWVGDRMELFLPVLDAVEQMIAAHTAARQSSEKNSG